MSSELDDEGTTHQSFGSLRFTLKTASLAREAKLRTICAMRTIYTKGVRYICQEKHDILRMQYDMRLTARKSKKEK
jgi:hypothetical protein